MQKKLRPGKRETRYALYAAALVLCNPAFFYNSAFWGQIDVIPIVFVLLAVYYLLYSRRYIFSALLYTMALLVKPTPIVYIPIFSYYFVRKFGLVNTVKAGIASNIFFIAAFLPLLDKATTLATPYNLYLSSILNAQSLSFVTNSAFNIWSITFF
ncbi:MAG: hypothetical protein UZ22_OP11002000351 [Microgenomates bacterium OLB23]|nr:MAG: hypothetical protein UZ22_OP11002000351 [Microgenomates bacterium OLB23]